LIAQSSRIAGSSSTMSTRAAFPSGAEMLLVSIFDPLWQTGGLLADRTARVGQLLLPVC
jgi:hypothetical protein